MQLIERMLNGDKEALWQIINENEGLIHTKLKGWYFTQATNEYEDVVSEIKLHLAKKLTTFKPELGYELGTYYGTIVYNFIGMMVRKENKKSMPKTISIETPIGNNGDQNITLGDTLTTEEKEEIFDFEQYVSKLSKEYQDFYYACHCERTKYIGIYEYCEKNNLTYGGRYNERFKIALVKAMGMSPDVIKKNKKKSA